MTQTARLNFGMKLAGVALLCALAGACAKRPPVTDPQALARYEEANDPLEPMNRAIFDFNDGCYTYVLDPLADGYEFIVPKPIRHMFANFLRNLSSPIRLINDLLQGDVKQAEITVARFMTNSTVGFAGLFDPATDWGMPLREEDFGQTLAVWGANEGAYLVLPFFGPSSARDSVGFLGDILMDPVTWILRDHNKSYLNRARTGAEGLVTYTGERGDLRSVQDQSLDDYAAVRSLIRQRRDYEITNGKSAPDTDQGADPFSEEFEDFPDFDE
jgi:phospholipid-binding lipoprotein MlaA